jgi:hypothetical protein
MDLKNIVLYIIKRVFHVGFTVGSSSEGHEISPSFGTSAKSNSLGKIGNARIEEKVETSSD